MHGRLQWPRREVGACVQVGFWQTCVVCATVAGARLSYVLVSLDLNGVPAPNLPGIANFMAFSAQSQMHLNADGLCYVVGQEASDPYYVPGIP